MAGAILDSIAAADFDAFDRALRAAGLPVARETVAALTLALHGAIPHLPAGGSRTLAAAGLDDLDRFVADLLGTLVDPGPATAPGASTPSARPDTADTLETTAAAWCAQAGERRENQVRRAARGWVPERRPGRVNPGGGGEQPGVGGPPHAPSARRLNSPHSPTDPGRRRPDSDGRGGERGDSPPGPVGFYARRHRHALVSHRR
ncbi:hypothetical protein [Embleya sp. NPDC059237]|uniref:hypothetical protein n=1 Tax=Embleya sp. NPDC059237 TaxID=3346784 RepID=UPI0036AFD5BE